MGCGGVGGADGGVFGRGLVVSKCHADAFFVGGTSGSRAVFLIGMVGDAALASE